MSRISWVRILALVGLIFLISRAAVAQPSDDRSAVLLRSIALDADTGVAAVPEKLAAPADAGYAIVKLSGPVSALALAKLEAMSERIYTYLPHDAFLVKLPASLGEKALQDLGARFVEPYHPLYKMAPGIAELSQDLAAAKEDAWSRGMRQVMVRVFPDADLDAVRARIEALGFEVVGAKADGRFARIRLLTDRDTLARGHEAIARIPEVFWLDFEARRVLLNDTTISVGQSGLSSGGATPVFDHGIYGEGQIIGVLDTGIDPDMCYFRDPSLGLPPINPCDGGTVVDLNQRKLIAVDFLWSQDCSGGVSAGEWDNHDHGSHVAGTAAGDDFATPLLHDTADGMAPGAKLIVQDGGFSTGDNCADLPGLGCPVVDLVPIFQQAYDQGARIHTNSWGDRENFTPLNLYSAGSEDADETMWNNKDLLLVFAAGNSGTSSGTVLSPSTAKSVLAVGATQRGSSADSLASFTSCGPAADGRIKPDVMAPGVSIVSANSDNNSGSNNCSTRTMSGTSMASPAVAGLTALVRQYYTDGFYPSGIATGADALTPSGALLKASMINSGREMGGAPAIPSNCQGWGRVLLDDLLFFPGDARKLFVHDEAAGFGTGSSGASQDFTFTVAAGEPLEVTLAWTDFPSTPAALTNLVNDLDLEVAGPDGTFLGNVFSGGVSVTGGGADRLNPVEQVFLASPTAGTWTVTVRSWNIPSGPQDFALVVTGDVMESSPCAATCGDGVVECNEVCDTGALGGATCGDFGCGGGTLACNGTCDGFDISGCTECPVCDNDGVCELGEDCVGCPSDCVSGEAAGAVCGNGVCEAGDGEDCVSCPSDCNGQQGGKPANRFCCGDGDGSGPVGCGDARCSTGSFSCTDTPQLPGTFCCGLFACETGESCSNCALDCAVGELCGDGVDNDCDGDIDCADLDCTGAPECDLSCGQPGEACSVGGDCCSGKCKGPSGSMTCR